jgi:hypothetical protein
MSAIVVSSGRTLLSDLTILYKYIHVCTFLMYSIPVWLFYYCCCYRESMSEEEQEQFWRRIQSTVEKDVIRTDRNLLL